MPGAANVVYIDSGRAFCRAWEYQCSPTVKLLMPSPENGTRLDGLTEEQALM